MSNHEKSPDGPGTTGSFAGSQNFVGGLMLLGIAALALYLTRDLSQGTLRAMGPAMLPRWLAIAVGACGVALAVSPFLAPGERLERWNLRGPLFVVLGILAFAVTIHPFSMAGLTVPGLGVVVAGPLAVVVGGLATPEARLKELLIMGFGLTAFCMVLFGDILNLPLPVFPNALLDLFPAGWSQKAILRLTAAVLAVLAAAVFFILPSRPRSPDAEIVENSGRV